MGLWTQILDHLEENHAKKAVSRNEPFSGHSYSFPNTRKIYTTKSTSSLAAFIIDTCLLSINQYFLKIRYFSFLSLLYI